MERITCTKLLRFSAGHRLVGHEGKCVHMHGHNYRAEVTCEAPAIDSVGRVVDFGVIKQRVGAWVDDNWDHGFIYNRDDKQVKAALEACPGRCYAIEGNPTAEHMARYLLDKAKVLLDKTGCEPVSIRLWETDTCYVDVSNR